MRIESGAGGIREQAPLDFTEVHRPRLRRQGIGDRALGTRMHAKLARQSISRAGRNDAERDFVKGQRRGDLVDRAVAAPRHHEARAAADRRLGQVARVADAFGDEDFGRIAVLIDDPQGELRSRTRHGRTCATGDGVDDEPKQAADLLERGPASRTDAGDHPGRGDDYDLACGGLGRCAVSFARRAELLPGQP